MTQSQAGNLIPSPEGSSCWLFPKGLYGGRSDTQSFAKRLVRKGVREESWRKTWLEVETESIYSLDGPIWVSDRSQFYRAAQNLWRINSIPIELKEKSFQSGKEEIYETLIEEMIDQLWLCLAISDPHSWYGPWGQAPGRPEWTTSVLGALVEWLPEMQHIHQRIANLVCCETAQLLWRIPLYRFQWAHGILTLCRTLGVRIDIPVDREDEEWDLTQELCRKGIIMIENGRSHLV